MEGRNFWATQHPPLAVYMSKNMGREEDILKGKLAALMMAEKSVWMRRLEQVGLVGGESLPPALSTTRSFLRFANRSS